MITAAYGIALLLFVLIASAYIWESGRMNRPGRIVYAASDRKQVYPLLEVIIQQYILDAGQETGGYHLVEPGAGLAILSSRLARKYPWQSVTAIELGIVLSTAARVRLFLTGGRKRVRYIRANLFDVQPEKPAVIYSYLSSEMITRLYQAGTLNNSLFISLSFPIGNRPPTQTIPLKGWQKQLLVYDFRTRVKSR